MARSLIKVADTSPGATKFHLAKSWLSLLTLNTLIHVFFNSPKNGAHELHFYSIAETLTLTIDRSQDLSCHMLEAQVLGSHSGEK